jgi:TPR repeat protein
MYRDGRGVQLDAARSAELLAQAVKLGCQDAQYDLGLCYELGKGVESNVARAVELYQAAVTHNVPDAQFHLGVMLEQGRGVPQDQAAGLKLITAASEQGFEAAKAHLAGQKPDTAASVVTATAAASAAPAAAPVDAQAENEFAKFMSSLKKGVRLIKVFYHHFFILQTFGLDILLSLFLLPSAQLERRTKRSSAHYFAAISSHFLGKREWQCPFRSGSGDQGWKIRYSEAACDEVGR